MCIMAMYKVTSNLLSNGSSTKLVHQRLHGQITELGILQEANKIDAMLSKAQIAATRLKKTIQ